MTPRASIALLLVAFTVPMLPAAASPCATPCGTVTAEPIGSSSTAEGQGGGLGTEWRHCLHTQSPYTTTCKTGTGPAYVGVVKGPSAGCAKGVLHADGNLVAESLWVC